MRSGCFKNVHFLLVSALILIFIYYLSLYVYIYVVQIANVSLVTQNQIKRTHVLSVFHLQ